MQQSNHDYLTTPSSFSKPLTAVEARPVWAGAKAAALQAREAMITDFMVKRVGGVVCGRGVRADKFGVFYDP